MIDELAERVEELETIVSQLRHEITNREYMIAALVQMLGPTGLKVWELWQQKGVKRIHTSWGPDARLLTGEQRAELHLQWEAAPKRLIEPGELDATFKSVNLGPALRAQQEKNNG